MQIQLPGGTMVYGSDTRRNVMELGAALSLHPRDLARFHERLVNQQSSAKLNADSPPEAVPQRTSFMRMWSVMLGLGAILVALWISCGYSAQRHQ